MKKLLGNDYVSLVARLVVGSMFVIVGVGKITDPAYFAKEIANYRMLPEFLINLTAIILPWIELLTGLFFIAGIRLRANAAIIGSLVLLFNIFVGVAWARGLDINCGCYSKIAEQTVGLPKLLENFGLFLLILIVFIFPKNNLTLEKLILTNDEKLN